MTHFVYIASSSRLLDLSGETHGRPAIKVGESWNPADREIYLNGRVPRSNGHVRSCGGFDDWKVVAEKIVASKEDGEDIEERFKAAFDPANLDRVGNGESDIVLLPEKKLVGEALAKLDADVRELYLAAYSRMYAAVKAAPERVEPYPTEEEQEANRTYNEYRGDAEDDWLENQHRAAINQEDGFYYEDRQ
jgi:hypothetical protein